MLHRPFALKIPCTKPRQQCIDKGHGSKLKRPVFNTIPNNSLSVILNQGAVVGDMYIIKYCKSKNVVEMVFGLSGYPYIHQ